MSQRVTIFGGSGFVGRHITRRMISAGWEVRVAVRHQENAQFLKTYGSEGQVQVTTCNILEEGSVQAALAQSDAVVNCVGILAETGTNSFDALQAQGAERIARLAADQGIETMVQISAIGADMEAASDYSSSKGEGEAAVLKHMPTAVILRPSIVFGPEDQFFNRFGAMTKISPFVPVIGPDTRFQPVYVGDVAKAAEMGLTGAAKAGIYELGGPDTESFRDLMQRMLNVIGRRRMLLSLPIGIGRLMAFGFDLLETLSFGLVPNAVITRDQVKNLARDNVVSETAMQFADLGITPVSMDVVLPEYLWRFSPASKMSAVKARAGTMRNG